MESEELIKDRLTITSNDDGVWLNFKDDSRIYNLNLSRKADGTRGIRGTILTEWCATQAKLMKEKDAWLDAEATALVQADPHIGAPDRGYRIHEIGQLAVVDADYANVPVGIRIWSEQYAYGEIRWHCSADNYMPRKGHLSMEQYAFTADSEEICQSVVRKYWLPIYRQAVQQLETEGELCDWG